MIADDRLYCMHVSGSDDVHPAPDRKTAQRWVARQTAWMHDMFPEPHAYDPIVNFTVAIWPWDAASHAAGLAQSIADNEPIQATQEQGE